MWDTNRLSQKKVYSKLDRGRKKHLVSRGLARDQPGRSKAGEEKNLKKSVRDLFCVPPWDEVLFPSPVQFIVSFFLGHPVDSPIPLYRPSEILYFLNWTSLHARLVIQKVRRCIYWHTVFSLPPVWLLETRLMMVRPTRTAPEPNTNTTDAMTEIQTQAQRCQAKLICNKIAHVANIEHWCCNTLIH